MATMYGPSRPPSTGSALTAPGADVFSWLLAGSHTNLVIVLLTVVASMAWGLLLIAAMVARNAALASSSVVVVDALISVPTVLIALILAVPLGASIAVIVIACGFGYGLNLARVARPAALLAARSSYVESALAMVQRVACAHKPCYAEYSAGIGCATVIVGGYGGVG